MPPFAGVAENVTPKPGQVGFEPFVIAMDTDGVTGVATEIVIELELAGLFVAPGRLDVMIQVTTSPAARLDDE